MSKTRHYPNDGPMQLLEWCGTPTGIARPAPTRSKRTHAWHASCSVLAVLASVLILNGCDSKDPVDQAAQEMKKDVGPLYDDATVAPEVAPDLTPEPVGAQDGANEPASETAGPPGDDMPKQ